MDVGEPKDIPLDPLEFTRPERIDAGVMHLPGEGITSTGLIQCPNCSAKHMFFTPRCVVCNYQFHRK